MQATIISAAHLPLPSASGIEIVDDVAYVIGDDSPYLYRFRAVDLQPNAPVQLFETAHFSTGRIPKPEKPDLEALTLVRDPDTGRRALVALGSGSLPTRFRGFWVELVDNEKTGAVYPLDLTGLYAPLRSLLPKGGTLNIEAAAATDEALWLAQRTVGPAAGALLLRFPLDPALRALRSRPGTLPPPTTQRLRLPTIEGHPAGLSGASWFADRLFVTASAEDTPDAVTDGAVLGSLVGVVTPANPKRSFFAPLAWPDGRPFREKVEGVAVRSRLSPTSYELVLVTDDDQGGSSALIVRLNAVPQ